MYMFHVSVEFPSAEICKRVSIKFPLNGYNGKVWTNFWFGWVLQLRYTNGPAWLKNVQITGLQRVHVHLMVLGGVLAERLV